MTKYNPKTKREDMVALAVIVLIFGAPILSIFQALNGTTALLLIAGIVFFVARAFMAEHRLSKF